MTRPSYLAEGHTSKLSCKTCQKEFDSVGVNQEGFVVSGYFWEHQCEHIANLMYGDCLFQTRLINRKIADIVPKTEIAKFDTSTGRLCYTDKIIECKLHFGGVGGGAVLRNSIIKYIDKCNSLEFWTLEKFNTKEYAEIEVANIQYYNQPDIERIGVEPVKQLALIKEIRQLIGTKRILARGVLYFISFLKQTGNKDIMQDIKYVLLQERFYMWEKLSSQRYLSDLGFAPCGDPDPENKRDTK